MNRLGRGVLAAGAVLVTATCTDSGTLAPDALLPFGPSAAVLDGAHGGNEDFFFLPPLTSNPNPSGIFNGNLNPTVEVCTLDESFTCGEPVVTFGSSAIGASDGKYELSWDTDGPETAPLDEDLNYRIRVLLGGLELGYLDVNPQNPSGNTPGEDSVDLYAFRLGETIPVKFWIGVGVLCDSNDPLVIECAEAAVFDETGGTLSIEQEGPELGVFLPPNAICPPTGCPENVPSEVLVIVERISNEALGNEDCIPLLDAPQYGPCFRIRTIPELEAPLLIPAVVSICAELTAGEFDQLNGAQHDRLQTYRYSDDGDGVIQTLANTFSTLCDNQQVGFLDVPEQGLMRYAALGINALARAIGPQRVAASNLGLGSLTVSFSRFRWGLPAQVEITQGDEQVANATSVLPLNPQVRVVDAGGDAVEGATVHFSIIDGAGVITPASFVTGTDGLAEATMTLGAAPGLNSFFAGGLGLLGPDDDFVGHTDIELAEQGGATFTATAVGPPANVDPASGSGQTGDAGTTLTDPLVVSVTDVNNVPVQGASVTWNVTVGDGGFTGDELTGADGSASGSWTLGTGAGGQEVTATVNDITATFSATAVAGPAALLETSGDSQTAYVGQALALPLIVTVTDQYSNPRQDDKVTWTVTSGGGTASPASGNTDAGGSASTEWTMGSAAGPATLTASVSSLTADFTATSACFDGWGTALVDGTFDATEWACAERLDFTANISGGSAPGEAYWMNDGLNLYLAVRVQQSSLAKANSLLFTFDNDADGTQEAGDDQIGYDGDSHSFFDQWLSAKCAGSSQSGCGTNDEVVNGSGAAANDGTWTVYELSHPLNSGDAKDFALDSGTANHVGFFLALRSGKGAQGNTQVPGFREFHVITIVGF